MKNLSNNWKLYWLTTFAAILKECEAIEDYENCKRLKDNMDYLISFQGAPNQAEFPHPFETVEDNESIFIKFIQEDEVNNIIDDYLSEETFDWNLPSKPKKRKKK